MAAGEVYVGPQCVPWGTLSFFRRKVLQKLLGIAFATAVAGSSLFVVAPAVAGGQVGSLVCVGTSFGLIGTPAGDINQSVSQCTPV